MREHSFNLRYNILIQFPKQKVGRKEKLKLSGTSVSLLHKMNQPVVLVYTKAASQTGGFKTFEHTGTTVR